MWAWIDTVNLMSSEKQKHPCVAAYLGWDVEIIDSGRVEIYRVETWNKQQQQQQQQQQQIRIIREQSGLMWKVICDVLNVLESSRVLDWEKERIAILLKNSNTKHTTLTTHHYHYHYHNEHYHCPHQIMAVVVTTTSTTTTTTGGGGGGGGGEGG